MGGTIPCYSFTGDNFRINVTKAGGFVQYFIHSRPIGEGRLTIEEALQMGDRVMNENDLPGFVQRYYSLNNGVLTINYAYAPDGVIFYPDLIKVGIAMDNGQAVSFDATGYLMNHTSRHPAQGRPHGGAGQGQAQPAADRYRRRQTGGGALRGPE